MRKIRFLALLFLPALALAQSTGVFKPGGALSGTWNSQNVNVGAGSPFITGILPVNDGGNGTASPGLVAGTNITLTGSWPTQTINASSGGTPGGSNTQLQYNNSGVFGGITNGASGSCLVSNGVSSVPSFGACSGSGGVTATGSPVAGELASWSSSTGITNANLSGDCTTTNTLAVTCLKTSGTNFGTFAIANAATPPAIGGTTPAAGGFTALTATTFNGVTIPSVTDTADLLGQAQTFTAVKTFTNSDIALLGSSTGKTTLTSANAGASNFTLTLPALTDTVATLTATQTLTNKSIAASEVNSGTLAAAQMAGLTGDVTSTSGTVATTVGKINGVALSGLATGIVKNTTTTGVPSIATSSDIIADFSGTCSSSTFLRGDGSCQTPAGGGSVSTTGTPASGNLTAFSGASSITNGNLSGDVTTSGTLATTVVKVNGATVPASSLVLGSNSSSQLITPSIANQTILGNGSGGAAATVTLTLAGNLVATSTTLGTTQLMNAQTGTTYAMLTSDAGKLVTFSNAASVAVSLSQATTTGFTAGYSFDVQNLGVGTVTITPATSTVNGASTLAIATNQGCTLTSDGANYQVSACTAVGSSGGSVSLSAAQTWTALQTFTNSDIALLGSSTGKTTVTSANASATNYTLTVPAATDTLVELTQTQTLTNKSIAASEVNSGTLAAAQMPALTGDVTSSAGAVATTVGKINGTALSGLATGILKNTTTTGVPSIATSADVIADWTGTCSSTTFLRGDGSCQTPAGSGTITSSTSGQVPVYTAATTIGGSANFTIATGALTLGVSGTAGSVAMGNATSGVVTLAPVTGALGTVTASLPANTGTIAELNLAQTWTAVQTVTNSDLKLLGSSTGANTFTAANASATNYTTTVPANTGTLSELNLAETWTAAQTFTNSDILLLGSSTGATTLTSANASATNFTATLPAATDTLVELTQTQTLTNKSIAATEVNSGTLAAAQMPALTGDVTTTAGAVATTVVQVEGAAIPTSAAVVATNSSKQLVAATTVSYLIDAGTKFTLSTGTGTCATTSTLTGGTAVGSFVCTGTGGASTQIVTLPTTTNGWVCDFHDMTTTTDALIQSASSTASATMSGTLAANDVVAFKCMGF